MKIKQISYKELEKAVYSAFDGDNKIIELYDPNVTVNSNEEIVSDVVRKIKEYGEVNKYGVYDKNILIGYIVNKENQLISFGLSVNYRTDKFLQSFLSAIKTQVGNNFFVYLWQKNIRAIKFLIKNGLEVTFTDNNIIRLQCQ